MRSLCLLFISFISIFGSCAPLDISRTDADGFLHCIKEVPAAANMLYITNSNPLQTENVTGYKDDNTGNNELRNRINYKSIVGDMDVIGASVIKPIDTQGGYNFDPTTTASPLAKKEFVQEDLSLFSSTSKFQNSSSAKFTLDDKSTHEQTDTEGKHIVYARLYWGGSIYKPWTETNLNTIVDKFLDVISGYSSVKFKTPDNLIHSINANANDVKWTSSFSSGNEYVITSDSLPPSGSHTTGGRAGLYFVYQASADVTQIVKTSLINKKIAQSKFTVGQIASSIETLYKDSFTLHFASPTSSKTFTWPYGSVLYGDGQWNSALGVAQFGGWSLVIVYDLGKDGEANGVKTKAINLYDGMVNINPKFGATQDDSRQFYDLTFSNFFTPTSGQVKSSLSFLGFGGRSEVEGENIAINKNGFESVYKDPLNPDRKQFNSSITRFGQYADASKKYNNQMDLDIFDISNLLTNKQKTVELRLVATGSRPTGGTYQGDRINIGMIAFSTEVYKPGACYEEFLYYKQPEEKIFREVKRNTSVKLNKNTVLKTVVQVTNDTNENAENFALKATINPSQTYNSNTTYIVQNRNLISSNLLEMSEYQNYHDNTGLQQLSGNTLTFYLGENAATNKGGNMLHNKLNYAYAAFEATLSSDYKPNSYEATVANSALGLAPYDTSIKKCNNYNYDIKIPATITTNDFIPSNKQDDGSPTFKNKYKNRLLTQIVTKPFNLYITNYGPDGNKRIPDTPVDVKVEVVTSCTAPATDQDQVLLTKDIRFDGVSEILIPNIKIDKAYKSVRLRISHFDPSSNTNKVACQDLDDFAVRPHHFRLWNTDSNTKRTGSFTLVGGEVYNNIAIAAMKPDDTHIARGYTHNIDGTNGEIALKPASTATCDPSFLASENKLSVNFSDGIGQISRHTSSGSVISGFSYSDIGDTSFYILDKSYTSTDQHTSPREDDCVRGSTSNDPTQDPEGRVGCNIKIEDVEDYLFKPKEIQISNLKIEKDDEVTYLDSEGVQKAKLTFDVVAKLGNNQAARLYKDGCYARATSFDIKLDRVPLNFTDNNGNAGTLAKANEELLFFEIPSSNTKKVTGPGVSKNRFYVGISTFINGKAKGEVNFNFTRKINHAKNPFTVSSNDFAFSSIEDSSTISKIYTKSPNETTAKFYYGRVYAPFYEGLYSGFNAKIYYGAYCDGCNKNIYMKDSSGAFWKDFPAAIFWSTNPNHSAGALGFNDFSFTNTYSMTVLRNNVSAINNGEQIIFVSNPSAVTDVAKMKAPKWLLYNEFDENAITNNFNLNFLVPNGDWAGKTLNKDNTKSNEGSFIGKINNSNSQLDVVDKTNRRIEW